MVNTCTPPAVTVTDAATLSYWTMVDGRVTAAAGWTVTDRRGRTTLIGAEVTVLVDTAVPGLVEGVVPVLDLTVTVVGRPELGSMVYSCDDPALLGTDPVGVTGRMLTLSLLRSEVTYDGRQFCFTEPTIQLATANSRRGRGKLTA